MPDASTIIFASLSFAAGAIACVVTFAIGHRSVSPTVLVPEVRLPDSLVVTLQQPPSPPAPKSRAQVWQEVYSLTYGDANGYSGVASQQCGAQTAAVAADAAVNAAFPPEVPPYVPSSS